MKKSRTASIQLNLKLLLSGLFLALLVCCSSFAFADSPTITSQQEPTINVPLSNWNELKERLMRAETSINNSKQSLIEAGSLTTRQAEELTALKTINEKRGQELTTLKAINEQQGKELATASNLLTTQAERLNAAENSLNELKAEVKRNKATEQRLRRQRDIWALVSGGLFIAGALRH